MTDRKRIALDANIMLRAVLGSRVRELIERYKSDIFFHTPSRCIEEAQQSLPGIIERRRADLDAAFILLENVTRLIRVVDSSFYEVHEPAARERISARDPNDWPIVATALLLDCPIWTEDRDFFGCGIATWTSPTVDIYLRPA